MTGTRPGREELWAEVERELRRFVEDYLWQPEWLWSPETQRLMRVVRPKLRVLDELRAEGLDIGVCQEAEFKCGTEERQGAVSDE